MFCPIAGLVRHFSEFCGEKEDFQFSHLLQRRLILRLLFGIVSLISSNWSYHDRFREFLVFLSQVEACEELPSLPDLSRVTRLLLSTVIAIKEFLCLPLMFQVPWAILLRCYSPLY